VSTQTLIEELERSQSLLRALVEDCDEDGYRNLYHPDLSPLGWHLGHCVYVECLWLHQTLRDDDSVTAPIAALYTPQRTPRPERGARLPCRQDLLTWAHELNDFNLHLLRNLRPEWRRHPLMDNDYLVHFLIQHSSQHYETMLMALAQRQLSEYRPNDRTCTPITASAPKRDSVDIPAGHYRIGGEQPIAYDNEVPPQQADLGPFSIMKQPVCNAEYLAFIEDTGYQRREFWTDAGWDWLQTSQVQGPDHWRQSDAGHWHGIGVKGACDLTGSDPVSGVSHHEASAFARWAGASLPHEYQWEAACRIGLLEHTGRVWEWCSNTFHPYAGFAPFPYDDYSKPWFDERHFSLKGGSLHTRPAIKRPSFRNFFEADKRHMFAGLRLIY